MPLELRKLLKNHFLLGFVPFGALFNDYIKPIFDNIYQLQNGKIVNTLEGEIWIVGRLGCITANLLQASQYGLSKKLVLDKLYWNRHLQTPQDAYHALASKAAHFLDITFRCLNTNREVAWLKVGKISKNWQDVTNAKFTNPSSNGKDYYFPTTANKISNLSSDNSLYSILYKWYTIDPNFKNINDDDIEELKFHVGDILEIEEESEGFTYAKIQAILQCQANNTDSAIFFVLK
ncbi:32196_t:CDS:2 [Gigaspora margarita]|uniref:32196_t:CDS:1 n=1 Tax=Gigaspora margarita TaxID=4874 RepID=A0ABN7UT51_GIGMA|nr:32196_t:CDS:2 [Gigaspora margarita]